MDRRREHAVDEAAARFADTLAESYRIVYEQAAEARERHGRLAQDFYEGMMDHLKDQIESGRAASERRQVPSVGRPTRASTNRAKAITAMSGV